MSLPPQLATDWRRLSPRMLLIHPIREVARLIPALIGLFFASTSSGHAWWSALALVPILVLSGLRWVTTRYRITGEQVQLRTGLFRRRTMTAPADRVRTVDVTAHALHRMLGLSRVVIGTGISDRKREGLVLDGLTAEAAGRLRAELLHRVAVAPAAVPGGPAWAGGIASAGLPTPGLPSAGFTPPGVAPGGVASAGVALRGVAEEQPIARLDPSWIRYAPFTLSGAVTAVAIAGFLWRVVDQSQVDAGRVSAVRSFADHLRRTPIWLDVVQGLIGAAVTVTVLSVLGYLLAFWNFSLTRYPGGSLHVSRGLITTRATSIEERRLRGVELSALLPLHLVGGARLLAVATGLRVGRGAERGGSLLMPACPRSEAERVAATVLGQPAGLIDFPLASHGDTARRRRLSRALLPSAAVTGLAALGWLAGPLPGWVFAASVLLPVLAVPLALDRYRNLGHARTGGYLLTQYGSLMRRRILLDTDGIIGWNLRQSFLQRRAGVATLTATTAAGRQGYRITDLPVETALRLADASVPGLLTELLSSPPTAGRPAAVR